MRSGMLEFPSTVSMAAQAMLSSRIYIRMSVSILFPREAARQVSEVWGVGGAKLADLDPAPRTTEEVAETIPVSERGLPKII